MNRSSLINDKFFVATQNKGYIPPDFKTHTDFFYLRRICHRLLLSAAAISVGGLADFGRPTVMQDVRFLSCVRVTNSTDLNYFIRVINYLTPTNIFALYINAHI